MQWSDEDGAGFTDGEPWLEPNRNYSEVNVEADRADPDSVWHHYRELIGLRHDEPVLVYGEYDLLLPDHERIYAYTRTLGDETVLVVLNWSDDPSEFAPLGREIDGAEVLYGNYENAPTRPEDDLRPFEAAVYRL